MFVDITVLELCGRIEHLSHDHMIVGVARPSRAPATEDFPTVKTKAPEVGQHVSVALPSTVSQALTTGQPRPQLRLRIQVIGQGDVVMDVALGLFCLTTAPTVERWVYAEEIMGGRFGVSGMKLRVALRANNETVKPAPNTVWSRTKGCDCDLCDPDHQLRPNTKDTTLDIATGAGLCVIS